MAKTGRAVIANGHDFSVMEFAVPAPAPGKILLRQELGGICGTDLHNWQNHLPEPTFMGHEAVGVIAALGAGVDTDFLGNPIAEGDRIVFHPRNGGVAYGFRTLAANIAVELPEAVENSTHFRMLYLAALTLFALTFVLNTVAEVIRLRFRKRAFQL